MTKKVVTNDGKKGGWLVGKRHYDKNGKSLGGIKAVVTDAGGKPVELEGGEVIINREASKKYWKELSRINQSAGNGVAIEPPTDAFDEDPAEDYENGGKIEFNANHIPNKWILNYAIKLKEEHPDVWALGGNIFGNQAFINLKRVAERGHWLDSEEWMYKKWRSFVARHKGDFRIQGVIAMLKWVDKVDKGWQYMKNLIEEEIKKREARKSKKMSHGGKMETGGWVQKPIKIKPDVYKFEDHQGVGYIVKRGVGDRITPMWVVSTDEEGTWDGMNELFYTKKAAINYIESFFEKGGKMNNGGNLSKTPAPASQRIKGSKFNASGSAKDAKSGASIKFDENTLASIKSLIDAHNEKYPSKKITLGVAKAVVRRGMGAYSGTHRPTITGGKPNSRTAWGLARLKAFIHKAEKGKSKSGKYSQDNDLFDDLDITVSKFATGGLISPTGKPSNLTPEQYKLVRTPEFKQWFGDWENDSKNASKVVDFKDYNNLSKPYTNEPLVVYHASFNDFNEFDKNRIGQREEGWFGKGIYFGTNELQVKRYGPIVKPYFLQIKKPFQFEGHQKDFAEKFDLDYNQPNFGNSVNEILTKQGFDGLIIDSVWGKEYIVFEPNQIKIADGTNTTFDANNPDIRFDKGGEIEKGIKAEYEHAKTIAKFKREGVSVRDVARSIAEDHLKEDPHYYSKLEKMEGKKFATGGLVTDAGGTANVGDKGTLETRNGRIDILITGITDKKVRFKIISDNNRPDSNPVERFVRNYRGASTANATTTTTPNPTATTPSESSTSEWRVKTLNELISEGLFKNGEYRAIGAFIINQWGGNNVEEIDKNVISNLNSGKTNFSFDGFNVGIGLFTKEPLPSTQSTIVHELENYRIKTEQEFINQYGTDWQKQVGWVSRSNNMDWLFGEKITDIVTSDKYDEVLADVKNGDRFVTNFSTKSVSDVTWSISSNMYMFDPALYSKNAATNLGQTKPQEFGNYVLKNNFIADDFKNIKIIVDTPDKSEAFQKLMLSLGIDWKDGQKSLKNTDKIYLLTDNNFSKEQTLGFASNNYKGQDYYENSTNKEIKFDDLFELKGQSKPGLSDESLQELFKDVKEIDKEREQLEATPQKNETQINDELKALEDEYNDLLFLIDITPSTDVDNMLSLKLQAKQLKDKIDLLHLDLKKKVDGELKLLDNLFNASAVQPQERYKFNAYNDGFAPDGQPTSLPKNLYDWTMTQEFQNWFGNFTNAYNYRNSSYENVPCSVVVNKHYEPLVVYHGTGAEFSFFKFDKFPAMYFAENEAYSNWFAEMKGQQSGTRGYVYPFLLNIRTPLDLTIYGIDPVAPDDFIDWMFLQTGLDAEELKISKALLDPSQKFQAWMYLRNSPEMLNVLRDKAICDGIIYYEDNPSVDKSSDAYQTKAYIVFNSNSAKIADPNREIMTIPAMRSFYLKRGGKL